MPQTPPMYSGLQPLQIDDPQSPRPFAAVVQYPTRLPPTGTQIGPYRFEATPDAPLAPGTFPLCLVSHGGGGSHLLYRTIATHLACNGYIVVALEHAGDNRNDRSLSNTDAAAEQRPRQASLALDAMLSSARWGPSIDSNRVAAIGHSMGGYTVLALLGGHPWSRTGQALNTTADHRVRAGVLLAPATDWFLAPGALDDVAAPLLVLTGERDSVTPSHRVALTLAGLPAATPWVSREIPGAGHYAFLSPFPPEMRRSNFLPATDPEGFDRDRFHAELPQTIHEYLALEMPAR